MEQQYNQASYITLNDGNKIPNIGFGTWTIKDEQEGYKIVLDAIESGYRLIDTASIYGSEGSVGKAVNQCGLKRSDLFITTKVGKDDLGTNLCFQSLQASLRKLNLQYIDLLLIHWPNAKAPDYEKKLKETWEAFCHFKEAGLVKSIGVSNFLPHHLKIIDNGIIPAVNQIEFHVGYTQDEVVDYCQQRDILVQAWSPLGQRRLNENKTLIDMAKKYNTSIASICLAFVLSHNIVPIPKTQNKQRMIENLHCFDIKLSADDLSILNNMPQTAFSGLHPDTF